MRDLEPLVPGEDVWITDARVQGTVLSTYNTPRSYIIQGPQGTLRRNRHHLVPLQTSSGVVITDEPPVGEDSPTPEPVPPVPTSPSREGPTTETVRTRCVRDSSVPQRLDMWFLVFFLSLSLKKKKEWHAIVKMFCFTVYTDWKFFHRKFTENDWLLIALLSQ